MNKKQCPYCEKHIWGNILKKHIITEHPLEDANINSKKQTIKKLKNSKGLNDVEIIDIVNLYETNSINDICLRYKKYTRYDIITILIENNIKIRNVKESKPLSKEKTEKTNLERYGHINPLGKGTICREKATKTMIEKYGVDNYRKYKPFYQWLSSYMLEKYGKRRINDPKKVSEGNKLFWKNMSPEEYIIRCEQRRISSRKYWDDITEEEYERRCEINSKSIKKSWMRNVENGLFTSTLENKIKETLDILKIPYIHQYWVGRKNYDFLLFETILLEINGDYWHANPLVYQPTDIIKYPGGYKEALAVWNNDKIKENIAIDNGYDYITIWESEIIQNKENLSNLLLGKLNENISNKIN